MIGINPEDVAGVLGFIAMVCGVWMLSHPAALIVAGTILMTSAGMVIYARNNARKGR